MQNAGAASIGTEEALQISSAASVGTFVKAWSSNILFRGITAEDLVTEGNGSFLHVNEQVEMPAKIETQISIDKSEFKNCMSLRTGGTIFYSKGPQAQNTVNFVVRNVNFFENYAKSSAVIFMDSSSIDLTFDVI